MQEQQISLALFTEGAVYDIPFHWLNEEAQEIVKREFISDDVDAPTNISEDEAADYDSSNDARSKPLF